MREKGRACRQAGFIHIAALLAFLIAAAVGLTVMKDNQKPSQSPLPLPSMTTSSASLEPKSPQVVTSGEKLISASGSYQVSGQTVNYSFSFPENGGAVGGSVSGICEGTPTGKFEGGEGGKITGEIKGSCGIGFLRQDVNLSYSGTVHIKDKTVDLKWSGNPPVGPTSGSFTLDID